MRFVRSSVIAFASSALLTGAANAQVGVQSAVGAAAPAPAIPRAAGSIALAVTSGAMQSIPSVSDNAVNAFSSPVTVALTWDLHPSTGNVQVVAYFADPAAAMTSGPVAIPSSWLRGRVMTPGAPGAPTAYTPFTQNSVGGVGMAGGSLTLMTLPILGYSRAGTQTIDLELQLDLTGRVLTPGVYSGTLHIRAVTQ